MVDANALGAEEGRVIISFQDHMSDIFAITTGAKAAPVLAEDRGRHVAGLTRRYLQEFQEADEADKRAFFETLLDLISGSYTMEQAKKTLKDMNSLGKIGQLLDNMEKQVQRMDADQRIQFLEESLRVTLTKVESLQELLGREVLESESDRFDYLLLSQSIVRGVGDIVDITLKKLRKDNRLGKQHSALFAIAIWGLLRVEAFRRGKIGISDLFDTNTAFLLLVPDNEPALEIELPDWTPI